MAKVILITTREFRNHTAHFTELSNYVDLNLTQVIRADGVGMPEVKNKTCYMGLFFDKPWNLSEGIMLDVNKQEKQIKKIKEKLKEKSIVRRNGSIFEFGIWRKKLKNNEYIYLADEFPFSDNQEGGFNYLNAIVGEIENDVKNDSKSSIDNWIIVSHDGDWCIEKNSMIIKEKNQRDFAEKVNGDSLKKENLPDKLKAVVEKEDSEIIVFQHSPSSDWYCYVQMVDEMTSIEDSETFEKIAKEQREKVKRLLEKEDFNPADFADLRINPRYPFLP